MSAQKPVAVAAEPAEPEVQRGVSAWAVAWRQFKRNKVALASLAGLVLMGMVSLLSPLIANDKPVWASYKGGWYFPAFKDYLDENFPIPFGIPGKLRRLGFFSPAYQGKLERPPGMQMPDWAELQRDIDGPGGRERGDWYLSAPVPFYYKQTSRGIKLLPGRSMARLTVLEPAPPAGEPARVVEYSPAERWDDVWRESRLSPEVPWARVVWSERDDGWVLDDGSRVTAKVPAGWIGAPGHLGDELVVRRFEHPGGQGDLALFEDLRGPITPLGTTAPDPEKLAERLRRRFARNLPLLRDVEPAAMTWTQVGGHAACTVQVETGDRGARRVQVWLVCCPDRVVGAVLTTAPGDPQAQQVAGSVAVVPAIGATVNGQTVAGSPRRLREGDQVRIPAAPAAIALQYQDLPRHRLGTDDVGRDVLSRLIHGTVIAGSVGIVSVSIYVLIGVFLGALAGYFRGWVDLVISRVIEVVICFPTFFLIITIVALWPPSIYNIMITLGLISWTGVARLVRGEFLKIMAEDYVQAARALGLTDARIIFRHVLPNGIAPVFVSASFGVAGAILVESSLSFLGFGVAPPTASWGEILQQGRRYIHENLYHLVWAPGFCIFLTVTLFNLVGEGLRDALDPKLRQ